MPFFHIFFNAKLFIATIAERLNVFYLPVAVMMFFFSIVCNKYNLNKPTLPYIFTSPAEELYFGSKETGEKKCLIVLTNITKNVVAFKVNILSLICFILLNVKQLLHSFDKEEETLLSSFPRV